MTLIGMPKEIYHPNAYLSKIKNIKRGLRTRTQLLNVLERRQGDAKALAGEAEKHYGVVMHHLRLLEAEGTVKREGDKPRVWALTGLGQKRLVSKG